MRTIVKAIVAASMLFVVCSSSFSQQVAKSIPNSTSPDGLIGFLEFRPSDYGSQKHPLIIFLHGIGERGNGTSQINAVANNAIPKFCAAGASMRFTVGGQTSSFVVLSPQLSTQYGYWPTFYVREMIKYAKANLSIDPNRIYITGLSLGGGGTWRAITDATGFDYTFDAGIAAAAPVCGTQEETDADFCGTIGANHLPIWNFHSMDDGTVPVGASQHAEILAKNCGLNPAAKFTYYQTGGHVGAWLNAYDTGHITTTLSDGSRFTANPNLYEWLLSNTRSAVAAVPAVPQVITAPVANAGNAQIIVLPVNSVNLAGAGNGTNGATISSYTWTKTSGPASGTIVTPNAASTSVTGLTAGNYVFTLTVKDNNGLSASAAVAVTVNAAPAAANKVPTSNAGANQIITLPVSSVTLNGNGSTDADGTLVGYRWTQTAGPVGAVMATRDAMSTVVTGMTAGNYTFVLEVTDNAGAKAYSSVIITVNAAVAAPPANNQLPESNAGANQTITLPTSSVILDGSASKDADGTIVGYRWTQTTGPVGPVMSTRDNVTTNVTGLTAGSYVFVLEVTDNGGLKAYSAVTITVRAATTTPAAGNLLGYIKMAGSANLACADAGSAGRIAIYGSSIANGSVLYTDAAQTQKFNGGWNWFSITPVLGGPVTQSFAVYPVGSIFFLGNCSGAARIAAANTTDAAQQDAALKTLRDSAAGLSTGTQKLSVYPNPVRTTATIELTSADNSIKTINVYNANGTLQAKYAWQTTKGINTFSLKNVATLANGLYVVDVRDANGVSINTVKFIKM